MAETAERSKKFDNSEYVFNQNTYLHFDDRDSEMYYVGDTVPDDVDMKKLNPDIFRSLHEEIEEYFDDYESKRARDLLEVVRARGLDDSSSRKNDLIAVLRADDKASEGGNDQ